MAGTMTSTPRLIPRKVLFGNPVKTMARLSPDGKRIAYLAPVDNVLNVWISTIGKGDGDDHPVTQDKDRGIQWYAWAHDNKHILYLQDMGGNENWHLYSVDVQTKETRNLTPFEGVQAQIVARKKRFPNRVLVALNKEDSQLHDVYSLELSSGSLKQVAKNPGNVIGWVSDADLHVRGAVAQAPDGGFDCLIRRQGKEEWEKLISWNLEDSLNSTPVGFSRDGDTLYLVDSRNADTSRLMALDLVHGESQVLVEDPQYDVSPEEVCCHPDNGAVQMVAVMKERLTWVILDSSIQEDVAAIQRLHPGDFSLVSRNHADDVWLISFTVDNGPISYYAFDRKTKKGTFLFDQQPELKKYSLASLEPVSFTSRDGLTIHGYLAYPPGKERKNLPLVLNVHGGPWGRDQWFCHPEVQWLTNRGYACLQVNFRGSTGYGKKFLNAGNKEWGGKMHDDLVDAVQWALKEGIADPAKVAVYGGSYGGYAALAGATFTPDLFCCSVAVCGPSNLLTFIQTVPPYWKPLLATFYQRVGHPEKEAGFLKSRSPLFKVDQIKKPMLIAHGANDPRVKQSESEQIVEAMKKKGIPYEYLLFEDEGHGFVKPDNRLKFYAAAEKFLARHLGGRFEE